MQPELLVHIGTFKTGTTALQHALATQSEGLKKEGILYWDWKDDGSSMNHAFVANALVSDAGCQEAEQYFARLAGACQNTGAGRAIISAENFYSLEFIDFKKCAIRPPVKHVQFCAERRNYIQRLRDCIGQRFRCKVVVYLRRQDYFLNSLHNQLVKGVFGYTGTVLQFIEEWGVLGDYALILGLWSEAFGAENILVRVYEPRRLPRGIVPDFFTAVLKRAAVEDSSWGEQERSRNNVRLSRHLLEYKRICNRLAVKMTFEEKKAWRDNLVELAVRAREPAGFEMLLSPRQRAKLLAWHEAGNRTVAKRYVGSEPLFAEPAPALDQPHDEYRGLTLEKTVEIGAKLCLLEHRRKHPPAQAPERTFPQPLVRR